MKNINVIYLFSFLIILSSCEKDNNHDSLNGTIAGFVKLVGDNGYEVDDKSGVNISIENTSYSATTNEIGKFEFFNVNAGTYNLIFSKEGFGTSKRFSYQFIGGNVPAVTYYHYLFQQPSYTLSDVIINTSSEYVAISGSITETDAYDLLIYVNDSANVSEANYDYISHRSECCIPMTSFSLYFYPYEFPFYSGHKIYLTIYGKNKDDFGNYDPNTRKNNYSSLKKLTEVFEIVIE